uniref:Sodium-coupled neutral amino acid transporter 10 n=1 Tax=Cacopsylla melanoneura TaxID=428564 RepID=A0A8D9AH62_9HEMI
MGSSTGYIMTISNSIIGVSVLAMPFCFKECGIVLSSLLLLLSNILSRSTCHFLLKSAIISRRRNYELIAFHVFGTMGKTVVELSIIGFMMGTCIAFFVVMGDLGPAILSNVFTHIRIETLRPFVLMGLAIFIVLPLGLLRNVDSLSAVSAATILFYLCLVLKMIAESSTHLIQGDWIYQVKYWNPGGLLQCLPIFSMALFCQTQLFDIFESTPNLSLDRMNQYIGSAINMCTGVYMSVGFFGYIAYYKLVNLSGNVLLSFTPNPSSEIIKFGFVLSVAVSFPLVIFPCRASIYSFLFRKGHSSHSHYEAMSHATMVSGGSHHIPESRFRCITLFIIFVSLLTAMMSSNIELVLGLVGATIGILICVLLPTYIFVRISAKPTTERMFAKFLFVCGVCVMFLGTYANLSATESESTAITALPSMFGQKKNEGEMMLKLAETMNINQNFMLQQQEMDNKIEKPNLVKPNKKQDAVNQLRQDYEKKIQDEKNELDKANGMRVIGTISDGKEVKSVQESANKDVVNEGKNVIRKEKVDEKRNNNNNTLQNKDLINGEAIKKEEKEAQNEIISPQPKLVEGGNEDKNRELEILEKLKKQEEDQAKIIEQQEQILKEVIRQNKQLEEMKQKDDKEGNAKKSGNDVKVNIERKDSLGKPKPIEGNLNQEKSVSSNNLISEKIQELNENIKELNRDELKLTNQIDKVNENIVIENQQIEETKNIANSLNNNLNPVGIVNQNVGDARNNIPSSKSAIHAQVVDTKLNNQQLPNPIGPNEVVNVKSGVDIGNANNAIQNKSQKGSDLSNKVVSKVPPLASTNGEINNIESPPEKAQAPVSPQSNVGVNNDAYIEIKKDLNYKKTDREGALNGLKPAVPIAIMLQPNEQQQKNNEVPKVVNEVPKEPKPRDVVKTRDILQESRREKRDVRVEPVNPVPPEYEVVNNPAPSGRTLLDGQMLRDIIEKTKQLERESAGADLVDIELQNGSEKEINDLINDRNVHSKDESYKHAEKDINDVINDGNGHSTDGSNKHVNGGPVNEISTKNNATKNELGKNTSLESDVNRNTAPLAANLDSISPSIVNGDNKQDTEKSNRNAKHLNRIGDSNVEHSNNINEEHSKTVQQTQNNMGKIVDTSNSSNRIQKDAQINVENVDFSGNKSKTDISLVNNNRNETIPSHAILNNANSVDDKTSIDRNTVKPINRGEELNQNKLTDVNSIGNRNTIEDIKDRRHANEVNHVNHVYSQDIGEVNHVNNVDSQDIGEVSHVNHVDTQHIGEDSNGRPNQNEQCERNLPDSNQDIRVPQLLSNLNPGDLILENEIKSIQNHVINIGAEKKKLFDPT